MSLSGLRGAAGDQPEPIERFLAGTGLTPGEKLAQTEPAIHRASGGTCDLLIAQVSPLGWHRHLFEPLRRGENQVHFFVFRERASVHQPVLATATALLVTRLKRYVGFDDVEEPVWSVLASTGCIVAHLPWSWEEPLSSAPVNDAAAVPAG
ncbi:hypothetical protein FY036_15205 [Mesorhizobium microcysteis]|uniref:Uncharacterized protein n=1 Tax=Neoaquamicrobium microcysteis TaxID=2682781 RepID=A0A5D4GS07_9HYPH|nr:hypothetical protein [Mesorhizobium microcysteis]TYR31611.1 hypothetical protein FY036_15205 [Mesorhizobium microcysteis]